MGYQHRPTQGPLLTVEQARRRNTELRIELGALEAENTKLESMAVTMRLQVTTARKKLTRQIRELDAARAQVDLIAAVKPAESDMPEPLYGGREGLQAAADEMKAHEDKHLKLSKPAPPAKPARHGTDRKYDSGCRCDECRSFKSQKNAVLYMNRRRKAREMEAA